MGWERTAGGAPEDRLPFRDRAQAGARLAEALDRYRGQGALVLGIPRGGVVVAAEVARRLGAELDVVVARKLGAPISRELAIGAVTTSGSRFLNEDLLRELAVPDEYLEQVTAEEMAEARRREDRYRGALPAPRVGGRAVVVIDDGLATGATMRAALRAVRAGEPGRVVVAVPVGSRQACAAASEDADEVVCLHTPDPFFAVGLFYERFDPTGDEEVEELLREAHGVRPRDPEGDG